MWSKLLSLSPLWKVTHCPDWIHLTSKSNFRIPPPPPFADMDKRPTPLDLVCRNMGSLVVTHPAGSVVQHLKIPLTLFRHAACWKLIVGSCLATPTPNRPQLRDRNRCLFLSPHVSQIALQVHVSCWESTGLMTSKSIVFCIKFLTDLKVFRPKLIQP